MSYVRMAGVALVFLVARGAAGQGYHPTPPKGATVPSTRFAEISDAVSTAQGAPGSEATDRRMFEDIEILRRLLVRTVHKVAAPTRSDATVHPSNLNLLFENAQRPYYRRSTSAVPFPVDSKPSSGSGAAFVDFDNSGNLDLFVVNGQNGFPTIRPVPIYLERTSNLLHRASILERKVHGSEQDSSGLTAVEGTYLPGQGLLYSISLVTHGQDSVKEEPKRNAAPDSPWDEVRKELQGQKPAQQAPPPAAPTPTLADALLKTLAESSPHLTRVTERESLSVIVTLRPMSANWEQSCFLCHTTGSKGTHSVSQPSSPGPPPDPKKSPSAENPKKAEPSQPGPVKKEGQGANSVPRSYASQEFFGQLRNSANPDEGAAEGKPLDADVQNETLLGDLHLKQGRAKEAVAAYQKALASLQKEMTRRRRVELDLRGTMLTDTAGHLAAAELYTKLARAHLATGDAAAATQAYQKLMENAQRLSEKPEQLRYLNQVETAAQAFSNAFASSTAKADSIPLPSRLFLSVSRSVLQSYAAGKISFDELRAQATIRFVEMSPLPPPAPKP